MRKMKDSGVEWIGEIPEGWGISKISSFYKIQLGKMLQPEKYCDTDTFENYLCSVNIKWSGANLETLKQMWFNENEKQTYLIERGDLITTEGGDVGVSCIWNGEIDNCYIQNALHRVRPKLKANNKFLYYWLMTLKYVGYIDLVCNKATIAHFTKDKFSQSPFIVPLLSEQTAIAAYLDDKCGKIASIMDKTRQQIEKLKAYKQSVITEAVTKGLDKSAKMKDSGVEWIGEIPEGWKRTKLKRLLEIPITDGPHETPELLDDGIPFISAEAVKNNKINFQLKRGYISIYEHEKFSKKCKPMLNDIFMIKSGATTGNIAIVETLEEFSIWSPLALIRCDKRVLFYRFLFSYMLSSIFKNQVEMFWSYGTQQNIGMEVLGNLYVAFPPLAEQTAIAAYLDDKCAQIDTAITKKQNLIEKLEAYKKSLIFEVVTGKFEV